MPAKAGNEPLKLGPRLRGGDGIFEAAALLVRHSRAEPAHAKACMWRAFTLYLLIANLDYWL